MSDLDDQGTGYRLSLKSFLFLKLANEGLEVLGHKLKTLSIVMRGRAGIHLVSSLMNNFRSPNRGWCRSSHREPSKGNKGVGDVDVGKIDVPVVRYLGRWHSTVGAGLRPAFVINCFHQTVFHKDL